MVVVMSSLPSLKGLIAFLFFTHNTMLPVLYSMITTTNTHYIRCCDNEGHVLKNGAQFRHGLDSQYGDVIFVMKRNFWQRMKGANNKGNELSERAYAGHFYKRDFVEYLKEEDKFLIDRWMELEALNTDFRPPTGSLKGKECKQLAWNMSWCNLQIHLGENIEFLNVEKVFVPAWILRDEETMAKINATGTNITLLRMLVSNQLPNYPSDGQPNLLNGLFQLYGPPLASDHYHNIEKHRSRFRELAHSEMYDPIEPSHAPYSVQTHRHSSSSSSVSISETAFVDLQVQYMADLVAHNMTFKPSTEAAELAALRLFKYD